MNASWWIIWLFFVGVGAAALALGGFSALLGYTGGLALVFLWDAWSSR